MLPVGAALSILSALKSLPATGMKHHSLLSHMMSIEHNHRLNSYSNSNVYQNSNRGETDRELQVKQFDTAEALRKTKDQAVQKMVLRLQNRGHLDDLDV